MGLFDRLELDADIYFPGFSRDFGDTDPSEVEWQTKSLGRPEMTQYRITGAGELLEEEWHIEQRSDEERPAKTDESSALESLTTAFRHRERVHDGWTKRNYHGIIEFHAVVDDEYVSYEAKFTDGKLKEIRRNTEG